MITLYWNPQIRAARMFWGLAEIGQPYELVPIDIRDAGRTDPPGFLAASPLRKVPALSDGDLHMADSAAIALYLADRYAPGDLAPLPDDPARGEFLTWLFYTPSAIEPAMTEKFAKLEPNPAAYPWGSFDRMLEAIETRLDGRDWLAAGRFTMADFMVASALDFMRRFNMLQPSQRVADYIARCTSRPAAQEGARKLQEATDALQAAAAKG